MPCAMSQRGVTSNARGAGLLSKARTEYWLNEKAAKPGSERYQYVVFVNTQLIDGHSALAALGDTGFGLDLPSMPGTDDSRACNISRAERPSLVRTNIVERAVFAVHIGDADVAAIHRKLLSGAGVWELGFAGDPCEFSHAVGR